ncbi:MAG: hypothetical protein ABI629_21365 [bacterium]
MTVLDRPLRRAITIDGATYVATLSHAGVRLTEKGRRKGVEVTWAQILSGEVTLHRQLAESLEQGDAKAKHASDRSRTRGPAQRTAQVIDPENAAAAAQARRRRAR